MANTDKNIVITPNIGSSSDDPKIVFSGADASTAAQNITLYAYPTDNGTLSFEGSSGQLFSITNSLSGTIFSVNDVSGIPSIEVDDDGTIRFAEFAGNILIGTSTDDGSNKMQVSGGVSVSTTVTIGPNVNGKYLKIGDAGNLGDANTGSIGVSNGNLHIDAATSSSMYLNYYDGTGGVAFGNGAGSPVAWMGPDGDLWKGSADNSGSKYWHAGNDGSGSGLDADTVDGIQASAFVRNNNGNQSIAGNLTVGSGTSSYIYMVDSDNGNRSIHCNSNRIGFLTQAGGWGAYCDDSGNWTSVGEVTAYSDERLKTDIKTIENAVDIVKQLRGVTYNKGGKPGLGVIAQEVEEVLPVIVKTENDEMGTKSVAYGNMVGVLIEAFKEQQKQIDELKDIIKTLTTK